MKKITLISILSIFLAVFMFSFDTFAAGISVEDPIEFEDGTVISQNAETKYYQFTAKEAAGYNIRLNRKDTQEGGCNYRYYLNGTSYSYGSSTGGNVDLEIYLNPGEKFCLEYLPQVNGCEAEFSIGRIVR